MRTSILRSISLVGLLLAAACDSSTDDVGANPGDTGGTAGSGQAGSNQAGSNQAGSNQAGTTQAGAGGSSAGAAGSGGQAQPIEQAHSEQPREDGSQVSAADRKAVVDGNNAFAFDLYGRIKADTAQAGKNVFFSPISFTLALGMTSSGSVGATQADIHKAMHYALPDAQLHPALNWLSLELNKRPQQAIDFAKDNAAPNVPDVALNVVNAVWGDKTMQWKEPFLDVLSKSYGTGINLGDFKGNPEKERGVINQWVSDQTTQRIKDLLPPGSVDQLTRLVLVNAINLTFAWSEPFEAAKTAAAPFTVEGGAAKSVPQMARQLDTAYAEDATAQSVMLPLFGGKLGVVVYLPKAGQFGAFESNLAAEVSALAAAEDTYQVDLTLPKFTFTTPTFSVNPYLTAMGMVTPFSGQADFSGMTSTEPLHVDAVYHKAMLGFDEVGVQAAAATAVALAGNGGPPDKKSTVHVDRSFVVGIRDLDTGALLFLGRIVDPTQG